jgi:hypothetical protein
MVSTAALRSINLDRGEPGLEDSQVVGRQDRPLPGARGQVTATRESVKRAHFPGNGRLDGLEGIGHGNDSAGRPNC